MCYRARLLYRHPNNPVLQCVGSVLCFPTVLRVCVVLAVVTGIFLLTRQEVLSALGIVGQRVK